MADLKVCYVANHAINNSFEGHNIASIRIIEAAVNAGIDARVVTLENTTTQARTHFYSVRSSSKVHRKTTSIPSVWEVVSSLPAILTTKNLHCDVVHLLNVTKEVFLINSKLFRMGKKCASHFYHSSYPFNAYLAFQIRSLMIKIRLFDQILSSNLSLFRYLTNTLGVSEERVHFVPYPVDINKFKPLDRHELREKSRIPEDAFVVAYVGAIDPDRGFFVLLRAFKKIIKENRNVILHISHPSKDRRMEDLLSTYVNDSVMKKHIVIQGINPHIEETYANADVVALPFEKPYWITAPPLVLLEAMASGTPIVTTPVDVIGEIGSNMSDMLFATPGDTDSLVNAILHVLENQEETRRMGVTARQKIIRDFSMQVVGKKLLETYTKICNYAQ